MLVTLPTVFTELPVDDDAGAFHVMAAEMALGLLAGLTESGVDSCVGGGWAVDALLGRQTRVHEDLDLWVPAADLEGLLRCFVHRDLDRILPWGGDRPWNIVLHDGGRTRVDLHLYEPSEDGTWHYGTALSHSNFPSTALRGTGTILGTAVRCEAPEWALRCHTGYPPRARDREDVGALCLAFGLPLPPEYEPDDDHAGYSTSDEL